MIKKKRMIILLIVAILLITTCVSIGMSGVLDPYERQIKVAYKFLSEGEYEEAVLAFNKAIEIDEKNIEAYIGLADAYFAQGDEAIENIATLLATAYEKTNAVEIIDKYISIGEELLTDGRNTDAVILWNVGWKATRSEEIKNRILAQYESMNVDDVSNSIDKDLLADFETFVSSHQNSGPYEKEVLLENFDKFNNPYDIAEIVCKTILGENYLSNKVDWKRDNTPDNVLYWYVPAEQMEWALEEYYNLDIDKNVLHNMNAKVGINQFETFYRNGNYYAMDAPWGGELPIPNINIDKIYRIDKDRYYFIYNIDFKYKFDFGWEDYSTDTQYAVLDRKQINGNDYWSFVKTSKEPISLNYIWEMEYQD